MTNKIIQKVCGFAVSAAMALSGIAGPVSTALAEDFAALAGAGAEENVQPEEVPVLYRITLPWTEHLIIEPEKEHIFIPDPDTRTEEEKKDVLLTYEAGEDVEIEIRAEDTWQITKMSFLDEKKEESGYEWKDEKTVHFQMPEKNLVMEVELTGMEIQQEEPQEAQQGVDVSADPAQPNGTEAVLSQQEGTQLSETQNGTADPAPENIQQPSETNAGPADGNTSEAGDGSATETEASMTYVPEKEADGLPVQGSIEQTAALEIVLNDAGFDAKIDLRNVPYDPEQYFVEYISDDILIDTVGTYSCIYKVTSPDSGKFFFVLRPVKVVNAEDLTAPPNETAAEASTEQAGQESASTEAGSGQQTEKQTEKQAETQAETQAAVAPESTTEAVPETEASLGAAAVEETEMETETEPPSGEYKVTLTQGEDLGVKLDHEDGTYNAGETVTFTAEDSQNVLIAAAALKDESNRTENTADILYSEVSYNEGQDSFSFEMPSENVSLAVTRDQEMGRGIMLMAAGADEDDESWDDQTDVEAGTYYYFSDGKLHPFNSDMGSGGNDSYKYVRYKVDGVTYTVNAYCMQHSETAPPSGHTYTHMTELDEGGDDVFLRKAIFYGYGGPGWGGTFGGQNIKSIMKDQYGRGSETRAMQHYIVDFLYDGESGFGGSLSTKAKNMIRAVKAALRQMPDPAAVSLTPGLSTKTQGPSTCAFTWNADPAYILTVNLEPGVVLVNDSTGARSAGAGQVAGGQTFHLEATLENLNLSGQYALTCNYPFDFHAMLLKLKNSQDIGFGYYTNGTGLTLKVEWVLGKPIEIQKYDKDTGRPEPNNTACTFEGAEYTVYSDQACTIPQEVMTLNASGYAKSLKLYLLGTTCYVKETKPPRGYKTDPTVHACVVLDDGSSVAHVDSVDEVIRGNVSIAKYFDDDVNESVLQNWINNGKLRGIRFTLTHEDPRVPQLEMTTDKYGRCETPARSMVYGTWTIKEDESTTPENYEALQGAAFRIETEAETLKYVVSNQLISVRIQINKRDLDTGSMVPIRGAKFQILDQSGHAVTMPDNLDYSKATDTFTTNEEGVIVLTNCLQYGTYTVKEVWAPDGYLVSDERQITLNKSNADNKTTYVVEYSDKPQKGRIRMTKIDKDTGETIGEGFTFDVFTAEPITDAAGVPYRMDVGGEEKTLDKAGIKVATVVTDENGLAVTGALYLGQYVVKEVGSAEYYAVNGTEYPVEICFDRQVVDVDVDLQVPDEKTKLDLFKVDSEQEDMPLAGITFRIFSSSDKEAEKARQIAEAVEAKRKEQQPLKEDFIQKQAQALAAYSEGEGVTEEDIAAYRENQEREAADYEASLEAECAQLEQELMVSLEVEDTSMLGTEHVTDENGQIHVEDLLHENTYTIYETKTLPGYNLDTTIHEFTVDEKGLINGESRYVLTLANVPNIVDISKKDITGNDELPGATLTVKDAEGNVIETWVSEETPHRIRALPAGAYTLTEEQAPDGYAVAEDVEFTVTDSLEIQSVTMYDEKLEIHFSKKAVTGQEELPGAHLSLTDFEGNVIEEWVSTQEEHIVNLKVGTYTLTETAPPDKYATAESITFEVKDDLSMQRVEMLDAPLVIEVSKQDITTGKELPGAHMTITDKDGKVVDEWDSTEEAHKTTLSLGDYILTEVTAPTGFARAESVAFTVTDTAEIQKVEMKDKLIEVEISKQDITNGQELPGAKLTITDKEGKTVEEWMSTDKPHRMNLPAGEYILTEVAAPDRYSKAESINFTVTDSGEVQKVEMKDKLIEVEVSKKDITNEKELPGAHLIIKDKDGKTVEEWTSTDIPHMVNLPAGDYTLTEVTAPKGYEVAETVPFKVTDSMEIQHVQMYDSPKDSVIDLTGKKKTSTGGGTPGSPGSSTPGTTVTASPVQTGDFNRYLVPLIILGAGAALLAVLLILKKKDSKRSGKRS